MNRLKEAIYRWHRRNTIRSNAKHYPRTHAAVTTRKAQP